MLDNPESIQNLGELIYSGALIIFFYSILWTLGTRDRRRILSLLHKVLHALEGNGNGEAKSMDKGGEEL